MEGSEFQILCSYKGKSWQSESCTWTMCNVWEGNCLLSILKLSRSHAGNYTCAFNEYNRTFTLAVLYPPKNVTIIGPYNVLRNSQAQFTCFAESYPPSTYWWTTDLSTNALRISTDATFAIPNMDTAYTLLYCFAQNKMVPTFGDPIKEAPISTKRQIILQESANIQDLSDEYGVYVGSTIDILCPVDGNPTPVVWWTKKSDSSFYRPGNRLTEQSVKTNFAGVYSCNARNVVQINNSDQTVHSSKNIIIKILATPLNVWTVVATATGWFVAMVVVAGALFLKCRKRGTSKSCSRPKDTSIELATVGMHSPVISDSRRVIPETAPQSQSKSPCEYSHNSHAGSHGASEETQRKVVGASLTDFTGLYNL